MTLVLANVVALVNDELRDYPAYYAMSGTGDGTTDTFVLEETPVVPGSAVVSVASALLNEDTTLPCTAGQFYLDDDSGKLVFGTAPALAAAISVTYQAKHWADTFIEDKISEAIAHCFHEFYEPGIYDELSVSASTYEYDTTLSDTDRITRVEYKATGDTVWKRINCWQGYNSGTDKYIKLTTDLGGTLRLHYISRPTAVTDLPDRAQHVLVPFAVWACLNSVMVARSRSDFSHNRRGENNVSVRELAFVASQWQMRWQLALEKLKMSAPRGRVVA